MSMSVSVVIPTHDRAKLLDRALASVKKQSLRPLEVIVVDDGSTDGTSSMLAERHPECRVLRQPNRGVSAARNRGIEVAAGDWIAFLDSDDEWMPDKLEAQCAHLETEPRRLVHSDEIWVRNGRRVNPGRRHRKRGGWIFRKCLELCAISPSSALVHRTVFEDLGCFDETLPACEDYDLWLRLTAREPVAYVDRPLVLKYGGHGDQLSRNVEALDRYRIRSLAALIEGNRLEPDDREAAIATLLRKIGIYRAGAEKRGRTEEAADLDHLAARYAPNLAKRLPKAVTAS